MEIVAQIFGVLAFLASVTSLQMKTYRRILWVQTLCAGLFTVHFFLLTRCGHGDAATGAALNAVCMVRDLVLLATERNRTQKKTLLIAVSFSAAVVAIGIGTWTSWISLLFIVAMVLNTVALSIPDPDQVRIFMMISAPFALAYDLLNASVGGTVNETVSFLSALTALLRSRRSRKA